MLFLQYNTIVRRATCGSPPRQASISLAVPLELGPGELQQRLRRAEEAEDDLGELGLLQQPLLAPRDVHALAQVEQVARVGHLVDHQPIARAAEHRADRAADGVYHAKVEDEHPTGQQ
eukprot:scaffold39942_cov59-Phaeocystis_antarctica.AAC.3